MNAPTESDDERLSKGQALRLATAALSGPLIVLTLLKVDWQPLEAWSGPMALDAEDLVVEALFGYHLTLMVATSLCVHRLLLPARPWPVPPQLPVLLWGLQFVFSVYPVFFGTGHWSPGFILFFFWLTSIVTFGILGLVLIMSIPGIVVREGGQRLVRLGLWPTLSAGVVVATVFLDWTLISTVTTEAVVVPALESLAAP